MGDERDFDRLEPQILVEHLTVPGFLRRIPHRWHLDDICRFGDKMGRVAESLQLAYLTTTDRSLGVIRLFPVPLLQRVYEIQAEQFNWPKIIDTPALEDARKAQAEALRGHERLEKHLRTIMELAESAEVRAGCGIVLSWIEAEMSRLRAELGEATPQSTGE